MCAVPGEYKITYDQEYFKLICNKYTNIINLKDSKTDTLHTRETILTYFQKNYSNFLLKFSNLIFSASRRKFITICA